MTSCARLILCFLLIATVFHPRTASSDTIALGFTSVPNAAMRFNGAAFQFIDGDGGNDFQIALGGSSLGLFGNISGLFTIDVANISSAFGAEFAPVFGTGTLSIFDGSSLLSATLTWSDIYTVGTIGGTNVNGVLNLSNISYSGSNADLLALSSSLSNAAASSITFQFLDPTTLTALSTATGFSDASYSGSITAPAAPVPDSGATVVLLGISSAAVYVRQRYLRRKASRA